MTIPFDENNAPEGYIAVSDDDLTTDSCQFCALNDEPDACNSANCSQSNRPDRTDCYFIKKQKATD